MKKEDEPKYIPDTIRETMAIMKSELEPEDFAALGSPEGVDGFSLHMGYGLYVRNRFGLWQEGTPLESRFRGKGLHHPDDMSSYLLDAVIDALRGDETMMDQFDNEPDEKGWWRRYITAKYPRTEE